MLYNTSQQPVDHDSLSLGFYKVARPKMLGLITHYGILEVSWRCGYLQFIVFELGPDGYRTLPLEKFADGENVTILGYTSLQSGPEIVGRIKEHMAKFPTFNLLANNCEHLASFIWSGRRSSAQVAGWSAA